MQKKPYKKPEMKEVKLVIEDTLLTACKSSANSTTRSRTGRRCSQCNRTYRAS